MADLTNVRMIGAVRIGISSMSGSGTDNRGNSFYGYDALWYTLGSYFIARDSAGFAHVAFGWSYSEAADIMDELDYLDLGLPEAAYTQDYDSKNGLYAREYERAWVFVNPYSADITNITMPEDGREITHATITTAWGNLGESPSTFTLAEGRTKIFIKETEVAPEDPDSPMTISGPTAVGESGGVMVGGSSGVMVGQ